MGQGTLQLSELQLSLIVGGHVKLLLKTKEYRIVSIEDFGNHWKVLVICRDDPTADWSHRHFLAIGHDGRLIWDRVC